MSRAIAWGARVPADSWDRLMLITSHTGLDPDILPTCFMFESGANPHARNPGSSATGLIQFMDATALRLGTTTALLAVMSFKDQLEYVEAYFKGFEIHGHDLSSWNLCDAYMSILWPKAIGKPGTYVLWAKAVQAQHDSFMANMGLDVNHDDQIIKQEVCTKINVLHSQGLRPGNFRMI